MRAYSVERLSESCTKVDSRLVVVVFRYKGDLESGGDFWTFSELKMALVSKVDRPFLRRV